MKAQRLRPKYPPYIHTPQCSAPVADAHCWAEHYRKRRQRRMELLGWDMKHCGRGASISIDGKDYCGQHAGQLAIAMLLGEEMDWSQSWDSEPRAPLKGRD